jgi:hypothetical protein
MICNSPRVNAQLCEKHAARRRERRRLDASPDPVWFERGLTRREWAAFQDLGGAA